MFNTSTRRIRWVALSVWSHSVLAIILVLFLSSTHEILALTITPINRTQPSSMSDVVSVFGFVSCRIEADFPLNHTSVKSRWILPDGTILQVNQNYDKYFVNQGDSAGGYETLLFIKRLSYSDADTYTCEVRDGRDPDTPGPWMTFQVTLQLLGNQAFCINNWLLYYFPLGHLDHLWCNINFSL